MDELVTHSWGPINDANFTRSIAMWLNLVRNAKHIKKYFFPKLVSPSAYQWLWSSCSPCRSGAIPQKQVGTLDLHMDGPKRKKKMYHYRASTVQSSFLTHVSYFGPSSYLKGCLYHAHTRVSCCSSAITTRVPLDRESSFIFQNTLLSVKDYLFFCVTHDNLIGCNILPFRLFTSLHTKHKLFWRQKLSHCCGPVAGRSVGLVLHYEGGCVGPPQSTNTYDSFSFTFVSCKSFGCDWWWGWSSKMQSIIGSKTWVQEELKWYYPCPL